MENIRTDDMTVEDMVIDGLLSDLFKDDGGLEALSPVFDEAVVDDIVLEEAVAEIKLDDAIAEHQSIAEVVAEPAVIEEVPAEPAAEEISMPEATPEKPAKEKKAKSDKPKAVRKHHAYRHELLADRMGADLPGYLVLELADASLEGDELKAKQDEVYEALKGVGTKVQNRMSNIIEYAAGKIPSLNPVITTCFQLLAADGTLEVSEKGKLQEALRTKYSAASAKSMGNNSVAAMHKLKVVNKTASGQYALNPDSLIYMKVAALLGLK